MKTNKIQKTIIIIFITIFLLTIIFSRYNSYLDHRTEKKIEKLTTIVEDGKVKKENEGKLVLVNGKFDYNNEELHDDYLGVKVNAPKLVRVVERYQWYEIQTKDINGKMNYTYKKIWTNITIDSSNYKEKGHENPENNVVGSKFFYASQIKVGDYELPQDLKDKIIGEKKYRIELKPDIYLVKGFKIYNNYATNSIDPEKPEIGDARISYYYYDWKEATVLAVQNGNSFKGYSKDNLNVNLLEEGKLDLKKLILISKKNKQLVDY